jgi:hypothetical protein
MRSIQKDNEVRAAAKGTGTPRGRRSKDMPLQLSLLGSEQQQEVESFDDILVDSYDDEPDEKEPTTTIPNLGLIIVTDIPQQEVPADLEETSVGVVGGEEPAGQQEEVPEDGSSPDAVTNDLQEKLADNDQSASRSGGEKARPRISPVLLFCLILAGCVVFAAVIYFFVYRQSR